MSNTDSTRSTTPTQPTRRDTRTSSTSSSSRGAERTNSSRSTTANPAVESAVTRLLVSIKALLECLSNWSTYKATEEEVSDVYVRLGNQFNSAVSAFASFNIDMSELMSIPDELRDVLERCLAEDASPEILEVYLPNVRQIITNLLQGLRGKQSQYRRIVSEQKHKSDYPGHERTGSRSSRSSRKDGPGSSSLHRSQPSQSQSVFSNDRDSVSSRRTSGSRRNNSASSVSSPPQLAPYPEESFIGGFATPTIEQPADRGSVSSRPPPPRSDSFGASMTAPEARSLPIVEQEDEREPTSPPQAPPPQTSSQAPPGMKRYSLVDAPVPPPAVVVEVAPSPPPPEELEPQGPNGTPYTPQTEAPPEQRMPLPPPPPVSVAKSLAALGHGDSLERRASKRFSTYNISKITGGATSKERSARDLHRRRSQLVNGSAPTQGDLDVLTEGEGEGPSMMSEKRDTSASGAARRGGGASNLSIQPSIPEEEEVPPVPPLPSSARASPVPAAAPPTAAATEAPETEPAPSGADSPAPTSFQVFLQVGREVKKATIEPGLSLSSLRMLFVDRFAYNPGKENFPAIYIRDPSSGVQYELEDMDEVKAKCLLSLNIEPLDQIKQHIDLQISSLSQDIKELRASVASSRHQSQLPTIVAHPMEETIAPRPSDKQLQNVARRLSRLVNDQRTPSPPPHQAAAAAAAALQPEYTGTTITSQMTGGSVMTEYTSRIVSDLRTQFDEVQNLRRDLGVMRQLYTEFTKQTKDSLGALRDQTAKVRQLASTSVGGARGYINTGKTKLDERSQNALTRIEELQDNVENVRDDVVKRHVTPKPQVLRTIQTDIQTAAAELESLKSHMETIKPMWKKTWAEELQNIVEEQQFLQHQEEFLNDLLEDHKEVVKVFRPIEEFIRLRSTGSGSSRSRRQFRPPPTEEGHDGLNSVMMEIRGAAIDPERRMKAIAANQRNRERDLADRGDEFERELKGFVDSKKLKKTGGAEEAERVRQVRNDMTLKAMFTSGGGGIPSSPGTFSGQSSPALEQGNIFSGQ